MRSLKEDILATTDKNPIDYDLVDQKVFWTDLGAQSIPVDKQRHEEERDYGERFVPL